ncbi:MAG: hypothetical protein AAFO89_14535 [Planctomycetota bacterium]
MRLLIVLSAASIALSANGQNLLNNPSFEDGISFDFSDPTAWNSFGDSFGGAALDISAPAEGARTGDRRLNLGINGPNLSGIIGTFQEIPFAVVEGQSYEAAAWFRTDGDFSGGQVEFSIEWFDAAGVEIEPAQSSLFLTPGSLTSSYQQQMVSSVAPANAVRANVGIFAIIFDNSGALNVAVDDVSFVPAPTTASLVALGGIAALRRRR